jgi:hypothetical protein
MDRALLVGINEYPGAPLRGCVNDVNDMANLLTNKFGFSPRDLTVLTDNQATKKAIYDKLIDLIKDIGPGDRVIFHYSGHGTQMPISGNAIVDSICPFDFDFTLDLAITSLEKSTKPPSLADSTPPAPPFMLIQMRLGTTQAAWLGLRSRSFLVTLLMSTRM